MNAIDRANMLDWFLDTCCLFTYTIYTQLIKGYAAVHLAVSLVQDVAKYNTELEKTFCMLSNICKLIDNAIPSQLLNYITAKNSLATMIHLTNPERFRFILKDGCYIE